MRRLVIAIDGPAGAGKSTVAQLVAQKLNYIYIDTGAMYRGVAWKVLQQKECNITEPLICEIVKDIKIELRYIDRKIKVFVDGFEVTEEIRTPEVTKLVSKVAQIATVRDKMLVLQRIMAKNGGIVMDGRDICTHVLPNAEVKLFLTASIEERAKRRWKEMKLKGYEISLQKLKEEIAARDKADSERDIAPLIQAKDAKLIDTTDLSIDETVAKILNICECVQHAI
ncbi:(d)CMP kinase [Anaerosinus massiliensis]|uniref:(d)CMP kinase n=1 Tax=Massilibacillus massiliensis TaxID=1806837 RepID=UPI000A5CD6E2|nr:(d)CMP kinase [Massilibacillus massiliensis]